MEKTEWFQKAVQTILDTDEDAAKEIAAKSLEAGMDPLEMINQGFTEGIRKMGDLFERGEVFLPGLIVASEAMTAAVEILEAALPAEKQQEKKGVIVLGTVEGDIHDIGKGIIATMLRVHGYEVHDIGRDVPIEKFIEKAKAVNADVIGSSAMMTTTQIGQRKLEQALKNAGMRDKVITMVGGAVATDHWAQRIGSDFFGESPKDTIMKLEEFLK
ncbi:MAG: B12-binding domain-containing protein [Desulfobacterales bacterium]|jgi:trimethylamine corrinoid protein|nr:MAG: B12-binding domain-containing protein [Desulfobacterales bacterium]